MRRHPTWTAALSLAALSTAAGTGRTQMSSINSAATSASAPRPLAPSGSNPGLSPVELNLLQSLRQNPYTAPYFFWTERKGFKVALKGRVGSKQVHDAAIQLAIALNVPVIDDLIIDTLEAHRAAAMQQAQGADANAGLAAGPGSTPGGSLPYTYPPPLFGRLDDPFFGYTPPNVSFPPWWGSLSATRLGMQPIPMGPGAAADAAQAQAPSQAIQQPPPPPMPSQNLAPAVGANANPAVNTQPGTIEMTLDPAGNATLRGTVATFADRVAIGQEVARTPGIGQVFNFLDVRTPGPNNPAPAPAPTPMTSAPSRLSDTPPPLPTPAELPIATEPVRATPVVATQPAASLLDPATEPVGVRASKALAGHPELAGARVKVREGVATLSGKVPTAYEAMLAYRSVQRSPGVRQVDDRLEFVVPDGVTPNPLAEKGRPEDVEPYLEGQLRRQLGDLANVDRVRMTGDSLEVKGSLAREEDKDRVDAIVRSMAILRGFHVHASFPVDAP